MTITYPPTADEADAFEYSRAFATGRGRRRLKARYHRAARRTTRARLRTAQED